MGLLQYTSQEMFSSTELIRKSKYIYEKLINKEIEKAIILRDGKPSFMLLDFDTYETIMNEYLQMKATKSVINSTINKKENKNTHKSTKEIKTFDKANILQTKENKEELDYNNTIKQKLKEFWD